ncbi:cleavage stimulation factor subunit 3-like isoform X2 [Acropora palmata]|uniref:cleavage stimulation factor subunit 3-like isoform X2 n=1 Tax=Acropora palmata TaxID=6131 RepID=UPI003DA162E8
MDTNGEAFGNGANERFVNSDPKDGTVTFWSKTERGIKAETRLQNHPYDTESWGVLIREAQSTPLETSRVLCEKLVRRFPNAGRYWRLYIEQEIKNNNYEQVEKLFQKCLIKVLNIDLWKCYLSYVRDTKCSLPNFRDKMLQAYEFALEKVGVDFNSYQIWIDFVNFLKTGEAVGSYAENRKIITIRKVYQRAVVTPMLNLEALWREYNSFEQSVNKALAKKLIDDKTREYMNARRVAKEYEAITRGLVRGNPSVPINGSSEENKQLQIWKKYIAWEKSNPLRTEDTALLTKRVVYAYEQCLQTMGFHSNVWCEAALYLEKVSQQLMDKGDMQGSKVLSDETAGLYERAVTGLMKHNMLLYFAYADFEEGRMKFQKAKEIYEKYLALENIDPTLVYIQYMKFARRSESIKESRAIFKRAREDSRTNFHVFISAALMEYYCSKDKSIAFKIFELGLKRHMNETDYVLAYVDYLSHLNDDNNTRVLFEKVLSSMPNEKASDVWGKFLEFEGTCGDLASLVKVENRKLEAYREELEGLEISVLVDRYKYLDLFPCTPLELKIMGYVGSTRQNNSLSSILSSVTAQDEKTEEKPLKFPRPDTSQMTPFKPTAGAGVHSVPGGVFPIPPAAQHLMTLLPPPTCFQGPFVMVEDFIRLTLESQLPDPPTSGLPDVELPVNGIDDGEENMDVEQQKRGIKRQGDHESDDEGNSVAPPVNDIYRTRQQKRVH